MRRVKKLSNVAAWEVLVVLLLSAAIVVGAAVMAGAFGKCSHSMSAGKYQSGLTHCEEAP